MTLFFKIIKAITQQRNFAFDRFFDKRYDYMFDKNFFDKRYNFINISKFNKLYKINIKNINDNEAHTFLRIKATDPLKFKYKLHLFLKNEYIGYDLDLYDVSNNKMKIIKEIYMKKYIKKSNYLSCEDCSKMMIDIQKEYDTTKMTYKKWITKIL